MHINEILFWFLTALALFSAMMVVFSKNPVHSVLWLIMVFMAITGHYIIMNAQFLAIVNIIVYAGAIMVLFLFVLMLMNLNKEVFEQHTRPMQSHVNVGSGSDISIADLARAIRFEADDVRVFMSRDSTGVRGIRLSLQRPDMLETQLRALLSAAAGRPLRIMFPMVYGVEEWRVARDMALRLREEIPLDDLQLGIMVEVPSAALLAPVLAREVDFFSIGTNDLTQYTLAIDRDHPTLSAQADGLHPAVLRLISMTVEAAHAHGKWVGVCGELAGDMLAVPLLVGLGVDELSVSARSIALVKARVRELDYRHSQALAQQALGLESAAAVRALMEETD